MTDRYTVLLRHNGQAFIVEDAAGDRYIFTHEGFSCHFSGEYSLERLQPRLQRLGWVKVPTVSPYTLDGLRGLLGASIAA